MRSPPRRASASHRTAECCSPPTRGAKPRPPPCSTTTIENAFASGEGLGVQFARWATAILFNGLGRYEEALVAARQASDAAPELFVSHWALAELVEACVRSGNSGLAAEALERLVEAPSASGSDWGLGIVARSRALVSEGEAAEALYLEAIDSARPHTAPAGARPRAPGLRRVVAA